LKNNEGNTLLHECALTGREMLMRGIRKLNLADESILNNDGETCQDIEEDMAKREFEEARLKAEKQKNSED
jgi:hypothetical protein